MEEMLLLQIFSGQQKKSRLRCEAVCKRWQSLIKESESYFAANARSTQLRYVILYKSKLGKVTFSRFDMKGRPIDNHSISPESFIGPMFRYASLSNPVFFYYTKEKHNQYYSYGVYNPLTRQHTVIPPITTSSKSCDEEISLSYAPQKDGCHFKFLVGTTPLGVKNSFSPKSELSISESKTGVSFSPKIEISIFDSKTGVWETGRPKFSVFDSKTGVWKTDQQECSGLHDTGYGPKYPCLFLAGDLFCLRFSYIFAFRLKTWTARHIKYPPRHMIGNGCFCESDHRLKYCGLHKTTPPGYEFCIWVLDEPLVSDGGNKWRKVLSLSEDALGSIFHRTVHTCTVCDNRVSAFDEDEGIIYFETQQGGLRSYDISEKPRSHPYSIQKRVPCSHSPASRKKLRERRF